MRLLLINQFYPPDYAPTGLLLSDLATALSRDGHEVHVLTVGSGIQTAAGVESDLKKLIIHQIKIPRQWHGSGWRKLAGWLAFHLLAMRKCRHLCRFDAVLAMTTPPFLGRIAASMKQTGQARRAVLWLMDLWPEAAVAAGRLRPESLLSRHLEKYELQSWNAADALIVIGNCMKERVLDKGISPKKVHTVTNWAAEDLVSPSPYPDSSRLSTISGFPPLPPDAFIILYSGNFGELHDFATVTGAAAMLADRPDIAFVFAGSGVRRRTLETEIRNCGLRNIFFMNHVEETELNLLLAAGHVHLASMAPGTAGILIPSKIYAAMAAARPLLFIGPGNTTPAELVQAADCGLHLQNGDAAKLAAAVNELAADRQRCRELGQNGRRFYEKHLARTGSLEKIKQILTCM